MTLLAFLLVLAAAFAHATWNFLSKKACGGTAFIWLFGSISSLLYFPAALWVLTTHNLILGLHELMFMLGSAVLHCLYFILLDKGYRIGDLSVIYPLARGTGPLISTLIAIVFLGERPSQIALAGALMIGLGIVVITGNPLAMKKRGDCKPIVFALLCGTAIAGYTITDKIAVSMFLIPPLLLDWAGNFGRVLLLTPYALKNKDKIREQWRGNRKNALGVAILSPLAYILVLTAMTFTPVSYIAPAREISILVGSVMGAKLLAESNAKVRLAGAGAMLCGIVCLVLG